MMEFIQQLLHAFTKALFFVYCVNIKIIMGDFKINDIPDRNSFDLFCIIDNEYSFIIGVLTNIFPESRKHVYKRSHEESNVFKLWRASNKRRDFTRRTTPKD